MGQKTEEKRPQGAFWKRVFKEPQAVATQESEQQQPQPEQVEPQQSPAVQQAMETAVDSESAVYKLWELWGKSQKEGQTVLAPSLALTVGLKLDEALPLTEADLERETQRIAESLEEFCIQRLKRAANQGAQVPQAIAADYFIHLSQSKMVAWGLVLPPMGEDGEGPSLAKLGEVMCRSDIKNGLDETNVEWLSSANGNYFQLRVIARGVPAVEGRDGETVDYFQREMVRKVETDDKGNVDYRAQSYFQAVCKGNVICDIRPPEPGKPGIRVDGQAVLPRAVQPASLPKGCNIDLNPEKTQLVAAMDGHVEFQGGVFQVKPTLTVSGDVDYSTGNILFRGDIHVYGDVRENFCVQATGKITVDGLVEGATIEADGDIVISKGVLGNNKALIKSKKLVRAKYLENCVVYSGDCTYADCIINSQIYSDSKISVTTGRGTVIGGCLTAAEQVQCNIIGSQSGRTTEIILGQLPYIQEEMKDNEISLAAIHEECDKLDVALADLAGRRGSDQEEKELSKSRLRRSVLALKEDKLRRRQEELKSTKLDLRKCRLLCDTIYPMTRVTIGSEVRFLDNMWKKCTVYYNLDTREIVIS